MFLHTEVWTWGMLECAGMLSSMLTHGKVEWVGNENLFYARTNALTHLECAGMLSKMFCFRMEKCT